MLSVQSCTVHKYIQVHLLNLTVTLTICSVNCFQEKVQNYSDSAHNHIYMYMYMCKYMTVKIYILINLKKMSGAHLHEAENKYY